MIGVEEFAKTLTNQSIPEEDFRLAQVACGDLNPWGAAELPVRQNLNHSYKEGEASHREIVTKQVGLQRISQGNLDVGREL